MDKKNPLAKYLWSGVAVGAVALSPLAAVSQETVVTTRTTTTVTTVEQEPTQVTGTVHGYWLDRSGYVTAMSVDTPSGTEIIRFSPSQARRLYTDYPSGSTVTIWATPGTGKYKYWNARGIGAERPTVWYPVNTTSDFDWLSATPYITADATETTVSGKLRGVVIDDRGDVLALALDSANGQVLVRVPAELRQMARGYIGTDRVAPLIKGSDVRVHGIAEAPRWGVLTPFSERIAADTIAINGKSAGAIGIQMLPAEERNALLGWNIGGLNRGDSMIDVQAGRLGYGPYQPDGAPMGEEARFSMATEQKTGRVTVATADGKNLPVVKIDNKLFVETASDKSLELRQERGRYVIPASLADAKLQMVMPDGKKMAIETERNQLMVVLDNGSKAPLRLHT